jgi:hypothetical protein
MSELILIPIRHLHHEEIIVGVDATRGKLNLISHFNLKIFLSEAKRIVLE